MPDVAPLRLHISRRYGFPFHRAARTLDGRLRDGRSPGLRLERPFRPSRLFEAKCQWHIRKRLAVYSCGRSRGFDLCLTAFPICTSEGVQTDRHAHILRW